MDGFHRLLLHLDPDAIKPATLSFSTPRLGGGRQMCLPAGCTAVGGRVAVTEGRKPGFLFLIDCSSSVSDINSLCCDRR